MKTEPNDIVYSNGERYEFARGLTKREYFAAMALQGALQWDAEVNSRDHVGNVPEIVKSCVKLADALIAELNREAKP